MADFPNTFFHGRPMACSSNESTAFATCIRCGAGMTTDEAALNRKYIGRHIREFLCPACLGEQVGLSADEMRGMILVFRRQGCRLFSPLEEEHHM